MLSQQHLAKNYSLPVIFWASFLIYRKLCEFALINTNETAGSKNIPVLLLKSMRPFERNESNLFFVYNGLWALWWGGNIRKMKAFCLFSFCATVSTSALFLHLPVALESYVMMNVLYQWIPSQPLSAVSRMVRERLNALWLLYKARGKSSPQIPLFSIFSMLHLLLHLDSTLCNHLAPYAANEVKLQWLRGIF